MTSMKKKPEKNTKQNKFGFLKLAANNNSSLLWSIQNQCKF